MKTVTVLRNGREIYSFTAERAEITGNSINFQGVPNKRDGGRLSLYYYGGLYYFVNYAERTATVRPEEQSDIELVVTW
jgi:hypothetical protein